MTNTTHIEITTRKGDVIKFDTPLSNEDAMNRLRFPDSFNDVTDSSTSEFSGSLVDQFVRRGRLSDRQWPWVQFFACKSIGVIKAPQREPDTTTDMSGIVRLFDAAIAHLKFPKLTFSLDDDIVLLKRCGDRSKNPGSISVTNGRGFHDEDNRWYGRITRDGGWLASKSCPQQVTDLLVSISADPEGEAQRHGMASGNCCFCNKTLTDERSLAVGYGQTCAGHWQMPWG